MTTTEPAPVVRPPSVHGMWTVSHRGVLVGVFKTRAETDEWLARVGTPESTIRLTADQLTVTAPNAR